MILIEACLIIMHGGKYKIKSRNWQSLSNKLFVNSLISGMINFRNVGIISRDIQLGK